MRSLTLTLWVVLACAVSLAVPIQEKAQDTEISRDKRSPGGWHSPPPEGVWKKELVWKEDWKKIWKTDKKLVWQTEWKKEKVAKQIWVDKWKQIQIPKWQSIEVPAWQKVYKPVWQKVWVPVHHEHHEHHGWD